ncbi:MAG: hypothetical protein IJX92_05715 [Clostridia bacterium]|nr:hypothetical protein [Clostridia bacterium]
MTNEIYVHAKPTNNKAKQTFYILLSLASAVTLVYLFIGVYKGIVGLCAVALITAAVLVHTKYIGAEYYYDITEDYEGTPVFVVRQVVGKRSTTLCRLDLFSITKVERLDREAAKKHKAPAGYKKYSYLPTLSPDSRLCVTAVSSAEKAEIMIEASDEFCDMLLRLSREARADFYSED